MSGEFADAAIIELERENKRLRELLESAVHHLDDESFPVWREYTPKWESWYKTVERLRRELKVEESTGKVN